MAKRAASSESMGTETPASDGAPVVDDAATTQVETTETTAPVETAPVETQTAPPALHETLAKDFGFVDVTPDNAQTRALEALRLEREEKEALQQRLEEASAYVPLGRKYLQVENDPRWQEYQRGQTAPAAQSAEKVDPRYEPLTIDERKYARYFENVADPTSGEITRQFREDAPQSVRQEYEDALARREQRANDLINDPRSFFAPMFEEFKKQILDEANKSFHETQTTQQRQQTVAEFVSSNESWLYQQNPVTNTPLIDRSTGYPVLSAEGKAFDERFTALLSRMPEDEALYWANLERENRLHKTQQTQQTTIQTATQTRAGNQLAAAKRRAGHATERAGSVTQQTLPQNRNIRPGEDFRNEMAKAGLI